jgi:hypothetical protein
METKLSQIIYVESEFHFEVYTLKKDFNGSYQVRWENVRPPYLVNIFHGNYKLSYETSLHPNKSNSKDFLFKYLNEIKLNE